jgi:hypothetical protein
MTAGNGLPSNPQHPGARSLRLVSTNGESEAPASSVGPTPSPALRHLQRELAAALAEARSLRELLEELPAILERKFQQRLQGLLREQRQLERENVVLQQQLLAVLGGGDPALAELPPETSSRGTAKPLLDLAVGSDSSITHGLGLRRALRRLHR